MNSKFQSKLSVLAEVVVRAVLRPFSVGISHKYEIECYDASGQLKWREVIPNIVVNVGLDDVLDKYYKGSGYTATHYVGLTAGTPTFAAGDTMSSHAGWTENTTYTEGTRPTLTMGTVSSQSVDNSAAKAQFSINGSTTVGGAFVATDSTKGGTSGTLVGGAAFSGGDRALVTSDVLNITVTATAASS